MYDISIYIYIYIYTRIYTHTHIYIYIYIYIHMTFIQYSNKDQINLSLISKHDEMNMINRKLI